MRIKQLFGVYIGIVVTASAAYSQSDLVNFTGLGRVYVTNDKLTGDGVKDDTLSKKRATNGYTIFDLGINVTPMESVKASVILRARNNYGGFYGDGSSLNIRQIRVDGTVGKVVKYQIGDIDVQNSPYTLYNFEEVYHDYESDVFKIRRDIVSYENFNFGSKWRLQGAEAKTTIRFAKGISKLKLAAYGSRIKRANFATLEPDRFLYGGRVGIVQSKFLEVGGNINGINDLAGTVRDSIYEYSNMVTTADVKANYDELDKFEFKVFAEFGGSTSDFKKPKSRRIKEPVKSEDFFYDGGLGVAYKPGNLTIGLEGSYRDVGAEFSSPGAQTRRTFDLYPGAIQPLTLNQYHNNTFNRAQTLFDRYTNEGLYNQSIRPVLMAYLPEYNNITPYGTATPNRKGITIKLSAKDKEKTFQADVTSEMVSEILGEGTKELRSFNGIRGGALVNIHKLVKFKKQIVLTGGYRGENTTRSGDLKVDLASAIIDAGLTVEVIKSFDLMGGFKSISAKGNEYIGLRNQETGVINSFVHYEIDKTEGIVSLGARYRFSNKAFFTVNYQQLAYRNSKIESVNYNLDQLFLNYTLVF